jgi:polyhydroxyalkanoate synthase subunit PhaC
MTTPSTPGQPPGGTDTDATRLVEAMTAAAEQMQRILQAQMPAAGGQSGPGGTGTSGSVDMKSVSDAFQELFLRMLDDPAKLFAAQAQLWQDYLSVWQNALARAGGAEVDPVATPDRGDKRFRDEAWAEHEVFDLVKQSYLVTARWLTGTVRNVEGLDDKTAQKVDFYTRQFVDAMAPTNFLLTNPTALKATVESRGENLVRGFQNLLDDLERGDGLIRITDAEAFELGKNVATTPGSVVFQNELIQLLQFDPTTDEVYRQPLLIIPPWINKYYILDLRPENSFIKWATERGYTVFVVSWVNPDGSLAERDFEDYMRDGPLAAIDAIERATGERQVSAIGYCIGGTLMAPTLAYLAAKGEDRVANCTFFATQVDFAAPGELSVFIDERQIASLEEVMERQGGVLDGAQMATTFSMLRSNDLIWSYVVNNYLMGKEPPPFDLLYWNSDATRMPMRMHSYYLRNMYLNNLLAKPGALVMNGVPIDLTRVSIPIYLQASKEDHIAPVDSVFKATRIFSGPVRFMMAGSGHIAGVINHPAANKYMHWTNDTDKRYDTVEEWLAEATETPGSWWGDWDAWLAPQSGEMIPARRPGDGELPVIEPAPGSYARATNTKP